MILALAHINSKLPFLSTGWKEDGPGMKDMELKTEFEIDETESTSSSDLPSSWIESASSSPLDLPSSSVK